MPLQPHKLRVVAERNTGNYTVRVLNRPDHPYWISVNYTGSWASGEPVELEGGVEQYIDDNFTGKNPEDDTPEADALARRWLALFAQGDLQVVQMLNQAGYDEFGNTRRRWR